MRRKLRILEIRMFQKLKKRGRRPIVPVRRRETSPDGPDVFRIFSDDVIAQFMSPLSSKMAFRTTIVSKSLKNKWKLSTNVSLDDTDCVEQRRSQGRRFVHFALKMLRETERISNLNASFVRDFYKENDIREIISVLGEKKIENARFYMVNPNLQFAYGLSHIVTVSNNCLFVRFIKNLDFSICVKLHLLPPYTFTFQNLCSLILTSVSFTTALDDDESVFFNFPLLTKLILNGITWEGISILSIDCPSLVSFEYLEVYPWQHGYEPSFLVKSPLLNSFKFEGVVLVGLDFTQSDLKRVEMNTLDDYDEVWGWYYDEDAIGREFDILSSQFAGLESLVLSERISMKMTLHQTAAMHLLTHLDIFCFGWTDVFQQLLDRMPHLTNLVLKMSRRQSHQQISTDETALCIRHHLVEVSFVDLTLLERHINVVHRIFDNAICLKKVILEGPHAYVADEVRQFRISSPDVEIIDTSDI